MKPIRGAGINLIQNFPRPKTPPIEIPNTRLEVAVLAVTRDFHNILPSAEPIRY
ncbi:MAG: hypothetical protein GTN74_00180 [Proteobacteria bacterium]|nr:hypothetical protein [Pseudomonadota bacterium]